MILSPLPADTDLDSVRRIALEVDGPIVCALARAAKDDLDKAWEAVKGAARPRIQGGFSRAIRA